MSTEIVIEVAKPHPGQRKILRGAKRFNVVACGRRFGKTSLSHRLLVVKALEGMPVAYFAPTYKMLAETWRAINKDYNDIFSHKNEGEKRLELIGGGSIDFWSLDGAGATVRGRKYARVVLDEAAFVKSHELKDAWEQSIRPLLTDYQGDAYFLSTPKGKKHYFADLADNVNKYPDSWAFFQMPTIVNPYINPAEVEDARKELPPVVFAQEYEALFTDMKSDNLFIYAFDREKHIPQVPHTYDRKLPLYISVDWNVNPLCAIIAQIHPHYKFIRIIGEYRLQNADVYSLCDRIKSEYDTRYLFITGDAAGWSRSVSNRGHKSLYDIVQTELRLNWSQVKTPRGKPQGYVADKRQLTNSLLARHPDFTFSNCPFLVDDIMNVSITDTGHMDKSDGSKTHLLDALCDFCYSQLRDSVKMINFISKS